MYWRCRVPALLRFHLLLRASVEVEREVELLRLRRSLRRIYRNTAAW
jgi:hypothetical protein